ncbi:MAG: PKD domain-containing protein [Thermoanaerobaculia bacterium]
MRAPVVLLPLALVAAASAAPAAPPPFAPAGFGGAGYFNKVWLDSRQPGTVWAASDVAGVFRSTDYGESWSFRGLGLGNLEVDSFAVDPFDSRHVWAGCGALAESTRSGIWTSTDAGATWAHLPGSRSAGISFRRFWNSDALSPDPATRGTLLSGSQRNGVFRSTDGGATFAQVLAPPVTSAAATLEDPIEARPTTPYPAPVSHVAFDPSGSGAVWAAFDGGGVYTSPARGVAGSWRAASGGLPKDATVKGISFSDGALWAAVGRAGVFRSTDGGTTWSAANGDLPLSDPVEPWVSAVSADPSRPGAALVTLVTYIFRSVFKTTDGGATWRAIDVVRHSAAQDPTRAWATWSTWAFSLARDPARPSRVFMTDYWSIQRSEDGGESWDEKVAGAQNTCVSSILPTADGVLVGLWDAGILRSTDGGTSWIPARLGDGWVDNHAFRLAAAGPDRIYATFDPEDASHVLASDDGGLSWRSVFSIPRNGERGTLNGLAVDPSNPAAIWVTQEDGAVWMSRNAGASFEEAPGQPEDLTFTSALAVDSGGRVFAGTRRGGLFRSNDRGVSWGQVLTSEGTVWGLLAVNAAVYAAVGSSNLFRTTDGGRTWTRLTSFTTEDDGDGAGDQGMAIAVDPADARHILFSRVDPWHSADAGPGLFESTDDGATWSAANDGLGITRVGSLAFAPDGSVWAGTLCGGTWRRPVSTSACTLSCSATVPVTAFAGAALAFGLTATPNGCPAGSPTVAWSFGDGASASAASATHGYAAPGTYAWNVVARLGDASCTRSGSVVVAALPPAAASWILPSSARAQGAGGAFYTTDLVVSNTGGDAAFTVKFLGHDADGRPGPEATYALGAGKTLLLADVLGSAFGVGSAWGALQVRATSAALEVRGETSTPAPACVGGTFGQSVPAVAAASLVGPGSRRSIPGVRESAAFRTNLVLANGSEAAAEVGVSLVLGDGTEAASRSYRVEPLGMIQVTRVVRDLGWAGDVLAGRLVVAPSSGSVAVYASVIDNLTNDPRTLLP